TGGEGLLSFLSRIVSGNLVRYIPSLFNKEEEVPPVLYTGQGASLELVVRNSVFFEELFMPGLYISPGTVIWMEDYGNDSIRSGVRSERIGYLEHNIRDLNLLAVASKQELQLDLDTGDLTLGTVKADTLHVSALTADDTIH
ncbi:hypothetical protein SMA90_28335, partial [Escherichia coli]